MMDAKRIINDVAAHYGVTVEALKSSKRTRPLPDARAIIFWGLCYVLHMSTVEAGYTLNRDHSTVLASIKKVNNWMTVPNYYVKELMLIKKIDQQHEDEIEQIQEVD